MQCQTCGKTGYVNLSGKRFCSNCGARLEGTNATATMSDIKPAAKTLDLRGAPSSDSPPTSPAAAAAQPAGVLHGRQVSGAPVLDLRASAKPQPAPAPGAPAPVPAPTPEAPKPAVVKPAVITTAPVPPVVQSQPPIQSQPIVQPKPVEQPVSKIEATPVAFETPEPTPAAAPPTIRTQASTVSSQKQPFMTLPQLSQGQGPAQSLGATSPAISKLPPNPSLPASASQATMPASVTAQIDAMQVQAATAPEPLMPSSPALKETLAAAKSSPNSSAVAKVGAALAVIGILSGAVWLQNSPKLAFHTAASQAGIDASLPTFMPSSYHQNGQAAVAPGKITLNFVSPSATEPLNITQQRTEWDADALRENYVSQQTNNFLAVQGQGLTIYMYNNQANWVNHGVWYQLKGTSKLGREQTLKIAYGL